MINKQSIWFLTLFSLILVLSVYYITMPNELLLTNGIGMEASKPIVTVEESEVLTSLRLEANEEVNKEIDMLQGILTNSKSTVEDKNNAFDKIKGINDIKAKEEEIEEKVKQEFKLESFVKITSDQVKVVIVSETHSQELANNIMKKVQEHFDKKMYITVKFQNK